VVFFVSSQKVGANPCGCPLGQAQDLPLPQDTEKILFFDPEESHEQVLARFRQVSTAHFREERERFSAAQACQRHIRSFRRDPEGFLHRTETLWGSDTS
jgi:hypothetical protein